MAGMYFIITIMKQTFAKYHVSAEVRRKLSNVSEEFGSLDIKPFQRLGLIRNNVLGFHIWRAVYYSPDFLGHSPLVQIRQ